MKITCNIFGEFATAQARAAASCPRYVARTLSNCTTKRAKKVALGVPPILALTPNHSSPQTSKSKTVPRLQIHQGTATDYY